MAVQQFEDELPANLPPETEEDDVSQETQGTSSIGTVRELGMLTQQATTEEGPRQLRSQLRTKTGQFASFSTGNTLVSQSAPTKQTTGGQAKRGRPPAQSAEARISSLEKNAESSMKILTKLLESVDNISKRLDTRETSESCEGSRYALASDGSDCKSEHSDASEHSAASANTKTIVNVPSAHKQHILIQQVKIVEPPEFEPSKDDPWMWLLQYKDAADTNSWDEQTRLKMVKHALVKSSRHWFAVNWPMQGPQCWLEFEEQFKSTYVTEDVEGYIRSKLGRLRQLRDQPLLDYFHTALAICIPASNVISERDKIRYIIQGMNQEAFTAIKMHNPTTITQLERMIKSWQEVQAKISTRDGSDRFGKNSKPSMSTEPLRQDERREGNSRLKDRMWCLNCAKQGHFTRACPEPFDAERVRKQREEWSKKPPSEQPLISVKPEGRQNRARALFEEDRESTVSEEIPHDADAEELRFVTIKKGPPELERPELFSCKHLLAASGSRRRSSRIICRINGQLEEAVVDTGATITVIPLKLVESTKTDVYEWEWDDLSLANGASHKPIGWCRASIEYQERTHDVSAVVLRSAPEALLGEDYHARAGLIISYPDNLITYKDSYMKVARAYQQRVAPKVADARAQTDAPEHENDLRVSMLEHKVDPLYVEYVPPYEGHQIRSVSHESPLGHKATGSIRSKRSITVPPRARARLEVRIDKEASQKVYMMQGCTNGKIMLVPGLGRRNSSAVEVVNVHNHPITIDRRERIGLVTGLDTSELAVANLELPQSLTVEQRNQVESLLQKHRDVFVTNNEEIGIVPFIKHKIDTGESAPIRSKPYRVSITEQKKIQELIDEMLAAGIIRPSRSAWASPIVLVKKRGTADLRFCVDYRKLNKITIVDPYPIPNMDTVLEVLTGNNWFSKLDVKAMYWQVLMDEDSRDKTAFVVHCGQYEFNVMPFGLVSAPMTAMRVMHEICKGMENKIFVFYDDMLVFTGSFEEHMQALEGLFTRLDKANIKLNAKKCEVLLNSVRYLGHVVTPEGTLPDPDKVESIQSFKSPKSITEARSFMGMCNFFRRFIRGFADIAKPIHDTIKSRDSFVWTTEAQKAMDELKIKLTTPPVLVHFDCSGKLTIRCDASGYGIGAVLMQSSPDKSKTGVIAYTSRTLSTSERNYATTHKECLAMVHAIKQWRHFVYGRHITVVTDHHALCWLMKTKDHTGQLMRWSLILQEYDFTVQYESGRVHNDADCLSRFPLERSGEVEDVPTWPVHALKNSQMVIDKHRELILPVFDIQAEQASDDTCKNIMAVLKDTSIAESRKRKYRHYKIIDDKLHRRAKSDKRKYLLVIPKTMVEFVLSEAHDKPSGGHFGVKRTLQAIRCKFYWSSLDNDVKAYVKSCDPCQRRKSNCGRREGYMISMPVPHQIFEIIGVDLVGPLPVTASGSIHIVVATCYLSKFVIAKPLRKATSDKIIEVLKSSVFYLHGMPKAVVTDNGSNLISSQMRELFRLLNIIQKTTSPYRPQTNGQVERYNRVLGNQLCIFAHDKPKTWDRYLDALTFAYNTTEHSAHLSTPYRLVYGREALKPIDNVLGKSGEVFGNETTLSAQEELEEARKLARTLIKQGQIKSKLNYDKNRVQTDYSPGDLVLRKRPFITGDKKFEMPWVGPYRIVKRLNDVNYQVVNPDSTFDEFIVHTSCLRKYCPRRTETSGGGAKPE